MAWYAYCIAEQQAFQGDSRARRPFPIENLKGLQDAQVMGYPSGEFAVIVSEYAHTGGLEQKDALEHARVVSEIGQRAADRGLRQRQFIGGRYGRAVLGHGRKYRELAQREAKRAVFHIVNTDKQYSYYRFYLFECGT